MSALAGIWHWNGHPVDDRTLAALEMESRAAGPHGSRTVTPIAGLAVQAHLLRFDSYSTQEQQPHEFGLGSVLTWDGRLDNRLDLHLALHRDVPRDPSDSALVAAAYARWGLDALPRLLGDWSLALWDGVQRRIILARDTAGNRPLYYLETNEGLAWATCLDALAAACDLYRRPNDEYIAGVLTFGTTPDMTPYAGARMLRAAHLLIGAPTTGVTIRRYWTFTPSTVRYASQQAYDDHLRHLITEGVRVRLRANRTVWAHLSGGWDSSSIVCLGHRLVEQRAVQAPALQPMTIVYPGSPEADEGKYIRAVERWCGLTTVRRPFSAYPPLSTLPAHMRPVLQQGLPMELLQECVTAEGDHIVMSGDIGDVVFNAVHYRMGLLEPLRRGDVARSLRLAIKSARTKQQRTLLGILVDLTRAVCFSSNFHGSFDPSRKLIDETRRRGSRATDVAAHFGVTPALLARAPLEFLGADPSSAFFPLGKRTLVEHMYDLVNRNAADRVDLAPRVWRTSPYFHRPLMEYVLGVPNLAMWEPGVTRAGMSRALADVLPLEIRTRNHKIGPTAAGQRASREMGTDLVRFRAELGPVSAWELVRRAYVDEAALTQAMTTLERVDLKMNGFEVKCLHLEGWLRRIAVLPRRSLDATPMRLTARDPVHASLESAT